MLHLKELRKLKNITQQELASMLGVTQATLSGWETEKYEIDNSSLLKCANIFDVSVDYLLGVENNKILNKRIAELLEENYKYDYTPFAESLNTDIVTILSWVKGASTSCYDKISEIADFFDVSIHYLLGKTDDPAPVPAPDASLTQKQKEALDMLENLSDENLAKAIDYLELLTNSER